MIDLERKIPVLDWESNAGSYKGIPVDVSDPRSRDPLVPVHEFGLASESFYARTDRKNWPYNRRIDGSLEKVWCRSLVAEKLLRVNSTLQPHGCELFLWDAYRPIACQEGLWHYFCSLVSRQLPNSTEQERRSFVLNYVSDPTSFKKDDPTSWPVHTSGAAVDLTLRDLETGALLDMGARFDEMSEVSHTDHYERETTSKRGQKTDEIRRNRRLLYWAMAAHGFINYPLEFWHYDWGNQMYIFNQQALGLAGASAAWFGYVDSPKELD